MKKGLQPGRLHSFGTQVSLGGAQRNLMVHISLFAHKFRGEDQKKGLRGEILGSVFVFTRVFLPGTKFYSRFRGTNLGEHRPRNSLPWPRACCFLSGHNPRWGGTLLAWGSISSDFGGTAAKCPPWRPA